MRNLGKLGGVALGWLVVGITGAGAAPKPRTADDRGDWGRAGERRPGDEQRPGGYVVRNGDTLHGIARRYGVSVESIMTANQLTSPSKLRAGQSLRIPRAEPGAAEPAPAPNHRYGHRRKNDAAPSVTSPPKTEKRHTVKKGDTIYSLATKYGIAERELLALNKLKDASRLKLGMVLRLPPRASNRTPGQLTSTKSAHSNQELEAPLPEGWKWHAVRPGESLSHIAARYRIDRRAIERANELRSGSPLHAGRKLKIPTVGFAAHASHQSQKPTKKAVIDPDADVLGYFVLKEDTIESVATQFATGTDTLRRLNQMGKRERLIPGRRIIVPNNGIFDR
jgi:LysM repeat protein